LRRNGNALLEVRAAVTTLIYDGAVLDDHDSRARGIRLVPLGEQLVDLLASVGASVASKNEKANQQCGRTDRK
jgi:hypothetical protein